MVELNADVVDPEAAQSRKQVLDGLDRRGVVDEPSLQLLMPGQVPDIRWNLETAEIHPLEPNPVISGSWLE
jgi:hypothetical protein